MAQPRRGTVTVQEAREACIAPGTRSSYKSCINQLVKWIKTTQQNPDRFLDAMEVSTLRPLQVSSISNYRSAIRHLYRLVRLPIPNEYSGDLKTTFSGLDRIENEDLQRGSGRESGKRPLPYSEYEDLCKRTMLLSDGGFAHLFLTTQWNLMCRSATAESVHTSHFVSADDSIGCVLHKTKTNQAGHGPKDPRHIYANPSLPATCWFTALGVYFACHPTQQPGPLFPGSNHKKRFGKTMQSLLNTSTDAKLYGTHSIRRGVATFACSGSTGGPSIVSVCLRCGWTLGDVQDRYFRYEAAGDQYLGRFVAGLPDNKCEFAVLPPHFHDRHDTVIDSYLSQVFPGLYGAIQLRPILRLCLASLVHHASYLRANLSPSHALLASFLFRKKNVTDQLNAKLVDASSPWMLSTGIPPHIELYRQQAQIQACIDKLPTLLFDGMATLLDDRGARAGNITKEVLADAIKNAMMQANLCSGPPPPQQDEVLAAQRSPWGFFNGKIHVLPTVLSSPA